MFPAPQLNDMTELVAAAKKVASARHPVSFSGAGLSAESGIATFRDKNDNALWSKFNPAELASQDGFKANPELVIDWYNARRQTAAAAQPNAAHTTLGARKGWIHITQNVDTLLEAGGVSPENVLHLHGTLDEDHCNNQCGYSSKVNMLAPEGLKHCPRCDAYLRPSVVWFGEQLPENVFNQALHAVQQCDLLLVVGTSAQVMPAAGLIDIARENGAHIIVVNKENTPKTHSEDTVLIGSAATVLPQLFTS